MRFNFLSHTFIFILLLSPFTITGNFQNIFAANLTPVADLTGQWSGFAQFTIPEGYCEYTGNVNAYLEQDGNNIAGEFSWVATGSKSIDPEIYQCDYSGFTYSDNIQGTISGSQITLQSSEARFDGWYASSGINLDIVFEDSMIGITQLSPTGFSPPPFESEAQDTDGDGISDDVDQCIGLLEDYFGENDEDGCPEKDSDGDSFYDYEDKCIYDAEDFLGIEDGCPEEEEDTDSDSFYDNEDVCPYDAEDYFEFGKLEGCPEEDSDSDNIYDSIDKCIDEPEDTVGDIDGCPNQDEFVEDEFVEDEFVEDEFVEEEFVEEEMMEETTPKFIEPPTPSVFKVTEETKPFFKALWDGKCDTLSHQYQLVTGNSGQLPIVCTGGTIALPSGEIIRFSAGDDFDVKLLKWGGEGLTVNYITTTIPPVGAFMKVFEAAKSPIETIKALSLVIKKGEVELFGGAIKLTASCATGNCKYLKTEEEGGGFKILDIVSSYNPLTKMQEAYVDHNSVYILVEYAPTETQETTSTTEEKITTPASTKDNGGCLIATATFGSELAPQVQFLREIRDNTVLSTAFGTSFMTAFNSFYYSFSPTIADLERQNPMFKEIVKVAITPLLSSLSLLQYADIDSEAEILGYGIGVILLNIGMYFVAPALIVFKLKNRKKE